MRHRTSYPDPIAFKANDLLQIGAEDAEYPGWIRVRLNDGNEGWAPTDLVRVLDGPARGMATADYCARELDVDVGDELQILGTYGGWHHVVNVAGEEGWVPRHVCGAMNVPDNGPDKGPDKDLLHRERQ